MTWIQRNVFLLCFCKKIGIKHGEKSYGAWYIYSQTRFIYIYIQWNWNEMKWFASTQFYFLSKCSAARSMHNNERNKKKKIRYKRSHDTKSSSILCIIVTLFVRSLAQCKTFLFFAYAKHKPLTSGLHILNNQPFSEWERTNRVIKKNKQF